MAAAARLHHARNTALTTGITEARLVVEHGQSSSVPHAQQARWCADAGVVAKYARRPS